VHPKPHRRSERRSGAIMQAPAMVKYADFLICESTYGDRRHDTAIREESSPTPSTARSRAAARLSFRRSPWVVHRR